MEQSREEVIVLEPQGQLLDLSGLAVFPAARAVAAAFTSPVPMDPAEVSALVEALLAQMLASGLKAELPLKHVHTDGLYGRELTLPAGTFAIGEIQKRGHISVIASGEILMLNEHGGVTRFVGPCTIASKPGVRKVGAALTDVVWTTVHAMHESGIADPASASIEELERFLVARTPEEFQLFLTHQEGNEVSA